MGLADTVRLGVAVVNGITARLQATVAHEAWIGQDRTGKPIYAAPIARQALVEPKQRLFRLPSGQEIAQRASVTFLATVEGHGADGRREPIDSRDRLTLPDGSTGPILDVNGLTDPGTNAPYLLEVALG